MRKKMGKLIKSSVVLSLCLTVSGCYIYSSPFPNNPNYPDYPNGYIPSYPPGTGPVINPVTPITPVPNPQPYPPNGYIPHHPPITPITPVKPWCPQPYRPNGYIPHNRPVAPVVPPPVTPVTPAHGNVKPSPQGLTPVHSDDKKKLTA